MGVETVEYENITRPASTMTVNIQGTEHRGQDRQRRSQQRASQHRSRMKQNQSATVKENVRQVEIGTRLLLKTLVPSHTQIVNASMKERVTRIER
jgi:hypothetical protein